MVRLNYTQEPAVLTRDEFSITSSVSDRSAATARIWDRLIIAVCNPEWSVNEIRDARPLTDVLNAARTKTARDVFNRL